MSLKSTIQAARDYLDPREVNCVVYHSPCNDGSGAALSGWVALGDKATYVRRAYHKNFEAEAIRGKNVVVIDASFKKDELRHLRELANKLMILDHHDSAMKNLAGEPGCIFTMHNSGAILGWHYFHGIETTAPMLLQLIEDRDLWRWDHRDLSEPLYYALKIRCPNTEFRSFEPYLDQKKLDDLISFGKTLVAENHRWCEQAALQAQQRTFTLPGTNKTYNIMCREVENDRLISELSEHLYTKFDLDFVMLWCKVSGDQYKISLRSNHPDVNVGDIASVLGGGGHKQAAGAITSTSPWDLLGP